MKADDREKKLTPKKKTEKHITPMEYRSHLFRLIHRAGMIYDVFWMIRMEKKLSRQKVYEFVDAQKKKQFELMMLDQYLDVMECLGTIKIDKRGHGNGTIVYVQDYSNETIHEILAKPHLFNAFVRRKNINNTELN